MQIINRHIRVSLVVLLLTGAGMLLPRLVASRESIREIRITARGMSFHVDTIVEPNPALALTAGEQVKLIFRNEDHGMLHEFVIPAWGVQTGGVEAGAERTITFKVPTAASAPAYTCTPHSAMMSGRIIISK